MTRFESKDGTVIVTVDDAGAICVTDGTGVKAPVVLLVGETQDVDEALRDLDEIFALLRKARRHILKRAGRA